MDDTTDRRTVGGLDHALPSSNRAVKQIDSLTVVRGIAAWWVVFYHFRQLIPATGDGWLASFLARGYLAVDLFFILSGFVIAMNYGSYFERGISASAAGRFLVRRLARIYPLHLAMCILFLANPAAILLLSNTKDLQGHYDPAYYLMSLVLVQNWGFTKGLDWNHPAWSISTEWLAYLLFPPIMFVAGRALGKWRSALALGVLALLLGLIFASAGAPSLGDEVPRLGAIRCVIEFCMGICVFRLLEDVRSNAPLANRLALAATILFAVLAMLVAMGRLTQVEGIPIAFAAFVFAVANDGFVVSRVVGALPLRLIGTISYSTYLVHFFVKEWVKFLLVRDGTTELIPLLVYVGSVMILSLLLYRFVEAPGRQAFQKLWSQQGSVRGRYASPPQVRSFAAENTVQRAETVI